MSTEALTPEQREKIAQLIGDAKPATSGLLMSFGQSIQNRADHEHPKWEDLYCLNLSSYMGERAAPVLRRLINTEAENERLQARIAELEKANAGLDDLRIRAIDKGDDLRDRVDEVERTYTFDTAELKRQLAEAVAAVARLDQKRVELERIANAERARVAELEAPAAVQRRRGYEAAIEVMQREKLPMSVGLLEAQLELDKLDGLIPDPTVFRASHDSISMGLYTNCEAAKAHCEAKVRQEEPPGSIRHMSWSTDDIGEDAEYELHITPAGTGELIRGTGYVVKPLTVASEYDEEADE